MLRYSMVSGIYVLTCVVALRSSIAPAYLRCSVPAMKLSVSATIGSTTRLRHPLPNVCTARGEDGVALTRTVDDGGK